MVKPVVRFAEADVRFPLKGRRAIQDAVRRIFSDEHRQLNRLQYVFCSDDYLLHINRQFLQHDDYTDIITFDLTEAGMDGVEGEIYISLDRVRDNAGQLGRPFDEELMRVIFHGALHLCGYRDKTKREKSDMRAQEDRHLRLWGYEIPA